MKNLKTYVNEIFDIAEANNVDTGVGMDMFLANIKNCGDKRLPYYKGAEKFDFLAPEASLGELMETKKAFSIAVRKNLQEIAHLRKEGKHDEAVQLVVEYEE